MASRAPADGDGDGDGDSLTDSPPAAKRSRREVSPPLQVQRRVVLNPADCCLDFDVTENGLQGQALYAAGFAYCWSGARATVGITGGKYCFGCKVVSEQMVDMDDTAADQKHLCRIGVSRGDDPVESLGESSHSFGYGGTGKFSHAGKFEDFGLKFGIGDTIICCVDLEAEPLASISYSLNGAQLGIATNFDASSTGLGIIGSQTRKLPWESAVFPHVLLKNVVVQVQFSLDDGLKPVDGYKPWNAALTDGNTIDGPAFTGQSECEVVMMVGLPASGKSTWAENHINEHPEKRYVLLGTNLVLDQMKVPGLLRKNNYGGRFDKLMNLATGIFDTLLARAAKVPRNYILDQTNVYRSARIRKLRPFGNYKKIAVVVFPLPDELKIRAEKRVQEMGKKVPQEAVNEMISNFVLPVTGKSRGSEIFDEVIFTELGREEAERHLNELKRAVKSASTSQSIASRNEAPASSCHPPLPRGSNSTPLEVPEHPSSAYSRAFPPGVFLRPSGVAVVEAPFGIPHLDYQTFRDAPEGPIPYGRPSYERNLANPFAVNCSGAFLEDLSFAAPNASVGHYEQQSYVPSLYGGQLQHGVDMSPYGGAHFSGPPRFAPNAPGSALDPHHAHAFVPAPNPYGPPHPAWPQCQRSAPPASPYQRPPYGAPFPPPDPWYGFQ